MSKITELLNVKLDEVFVTTDTFCEFKLDSVGGVYRLLKRIRDSEDEWEDVNSAYLIHLIDHTSNIRHINTWTEKDIEDAKALNRILGRSYDPEHIFIQRRSIEITVDMMIDDDSVVAESIVIPGENFPSLKEHPFNVDKFIRVNLKEILDYESKL